MKIDLDNYGDDNQSAHLFKLEKRFRVAMNRWEIAFYATNGRMTDVERFYSREAYRAFDIWQSELENIA